MLRKVYIRIASMMIISTFLLLGVLGGIMYIVLRRQLQESGRASLRSEISEVQETVMDQQILHINQKNQLAFADDKGQNVYFAVLDAQKVLLISSKLPVPATQIQTSRDGFSIIHYHHRPYRVLRLTWRYRGQNLEIYVYQLIAEEVETLMHVQAVMVVVGFIGALLAIGSNLWLAHRAIRPARETWNGQQDMLIELSHELQTPLATMQATIAAANTQDDALRKTLYREIRHASSLVQDILYLAKLRSLPIPQMSPIAVSDVTEEVAERFATLATERKLTLHGAAQPGLYARTTSEHWSRLVSTLLKNVMDHAVAPSEASWSLSADRDFVYLVIKNRVTTSASARPRSTEHRGFGLHIAKRLTEAMKGQFEQKADAHTVTSTVRIPRLR